MNQAQYLLRILHTWTAFATLGTHPVLRLYTLPQQRATRASERLLALSGDAYVRELRTTQGRFWRFGTAQVEKRVELKDGRLALVSFRDNLGQHELVQGPSDLLQFDWNGQTITGRSGGWILDRATTRTLKQGELLLQLVLHRADVAVIKSYLVYPKESIVQEWLRIVNRSKQSAVLGNPAALTMSLLQHEVMTGALDFSYMTGHDKIGGLGRFRLYTVPLRDTSLTFRGRGSIEYSPIHVYYNHNTQRGLFIGWDYLGLWSSDVGLAGGSPLRMDFRVAAYQRSLAPGDTVETPKAFTGVFHGDLDEMGHQLLDYQYRYKWDYTRDPAFPTVQMEGYWQPGGVFGPFDPVSLYRAVFHLADMLRAVGADTYWRDYGWWHTRGQWDGPDWGETGRYLARYGMRQIIYLPIYEVESESQVLKDHPDWVAGHGNITLQLDQSLPAVLKWELATLESKQRRWGDFQWRKDQDAIVIGNDSSVALAQDQGFRRLLQTFLDRNPGMTFHGCDAGGRDLGYEMLRMGVSWSMEDWFADNIGAYYTSYIYPPDKVETYPDVFDPKAYTKAWRHLMWNRFGTQGEVEVPETLDGVRQLFDIYHYLAKHGVVGRWAWVYHPRIDGDSARWYLQRLSGDHRRGIVIPAHMTSGSVIIYPKGLLPTATYHVSFQESRVTERRQGADLMARGISLPQVAEGELIYLNLPFHPGNGVDHTPPAPPAHVTQQETSHMDYSGVALRWTPGRDDHWISYYEIYRNGVPIGKVAKGTYYFDHALGADLAARYAVATVDGSGNASVAMPARAAIGPAALVIDDTSSMLRYTGTGWRHETNQLSVAYGTQAQTSTPGDAVSLTFTGSRITWYGRMGPDTGVAAVYLDGKLDRVVMTYSGQEMANVALYSHVFPSLEQHTLKIVAAKAGRVVIDGFKVDRTQPRAGGMQAYTAALFLGTGWHQPVPPANDSGRPSGPTSSGRQSSQAGDAAEYTFAGSGVVLVGRRCDSCGLADVYIDGTLVTTVDTYVQRVTALGLPDPAQQEQVPLFTQRWTARGRHRLRVVIRGEANPWAAGSTVDLDGVYVIP